MEKPGKKESRLPVEGMVRTHTDERGLSYFEKCIVSEETSDGYLVLYLESVWKRWA